MEEYAGVLSGGLAAALFFGIALEFVLGGAGLCQLVLDFAQGIC